MGAVFFGGLAIGVVAGVVAAVLTLRLTGVLKGPEAPPPQWIDTGRWEDVSTATRL